MSRPNATWLALTLCSALAFGCLADLKPEVGPELDGLKASGGTDAGATDAAMPMSNTDAGMTAATDAGAAQDVDAAIVDAAVAHDAGPSCAIKDSNPSKDISFKADVMPILAACSCHSPDSDDTQGIMMADLTIDGFTNLLKGGKNSRNKVVVPGNACESIILQKLSENPPFGVRMPKDGPYLSIEERTLISDWIVEGARDN